MRPLKSLLFVLVSLSACNPVTSASATDDGPLLQSLSAQVALPEHAAVASSADALNAALKALEATPNATTLSAAQDAWRTARSAYRTLDALHFGPVSKLGIDSRIDVAPADVSGIDAEVSGSAALNASTVSDSGGKLKGWLGVEHLLFGGPTDDWADSRRWTLARLMGDEIASSAHQLNDAWMGTTGFASEISNAGSGSTLYPTQRAALNNLVGGVSYALEVVVGIRLGLPLGHKGDGTPNPSLDPTLASDSAVADITAALNGISALYSVDHGFVEALQAKSTALETQTQSQLTDCQAKIAAIPKPFGDAVVHSTAVVQSAYDACKAFKTTWNTDVSSALGATFFNDTDGD